MWVQPRFGDGAAPVICEEMRVRLGGMSNAPRDVEELLGLGRLMEARPEMLRAAAAGLLRVRDPFQPALHVLNIGLAMNFELRQIEPFVRIDGLLSDKRHGARRRNLHQQDAAAVSKSSGFRRS